MVSKTTFYSVVQEGTRSTLSDPQLFVALIRRNHSDPHQPPSLARRKSVSLRASDSSGRLGEPTNCVSLVAFVTEWSR